MENSLSIRIFCPVHFHDLSNENRVNSSINLPLINRISVHGFRITRSWHYPLAPEFFSTSVFAIKCIAFKGASYRLQTHRRGAHMNFFTIPPLKEIEILVREDHMVLQGVKGLLKFFSVFHDIIRT